MTPTPIAYSERDEALVLRVARGEEHALGMLYNRHGLKSFSLALTMLRDAADAEEVVGDAFSQIWRTARSFDVLRGSVMAWIATITRSRSRDRLRMRRRAEMGFAAVLASGKGAIEEFVAAEAPDGASMVEHEELRAQVRLALVELTPLQREVVHLAYFADLSQREIAARLEVPLGTVKTRVRAALVRLRESLTSLREARP